MIVSESVTSTPAWKLSSYDLLVAVTSIVSLRVSLLSMLDVFIDLSVNQAGFAVWNDKQH